MLHQAAIVPVVVGHPHRVRVGGTGAGPQLAGSLQGRTADGHVAGHNSHWPTRI